MQEKQSSDEHDPQAAVNGDVSRPVRKRFQFSLARLLGATAMVAITFSVARMLLDKEISTYAILVAVFAADLGLLVLVAQKKSDLYRILRTIIVVLLYGLTCSILLTILNEKGLAALIQLIIYLLLAPLFMGLNKLKKTAEAKEKSLEAEQADSLFKKE